MTESMAVTFGPACGLPIWIQFFSTQCDRSHRVLRQVIGIFSREERRSNEKDGTQNKGSDVHVGCSLLFFVCNPGQWRDLARLTSSATLVLVWLTRVSRGQFPHGTLLRDGLPSNWSGNSAQGESGFRSHGCGIRTASGSSISVGCIYSYPPFFRRRFAFHQIEKVHPPDNDFAIGLAASAQPLTAVLFCTIG